jgi:hypothetical protein
MRRLAIGIRDHKPVFTNGPHVFLESCAAPSHKSETSPFMESHLRSLDRSRGAKGSALLIDHFLPPLWCANFVGHT